MKALVAGWFSFQGMGTTAGDLMVRDVVCDWLEAAGFMYDVAIASPFAHERGIDCAVQRRAITPVWSSSAARLATDRR